MMAAPRSASGWSVGIVGAGIVGCAAAHFLAAEGADVTVFDESGVGAGASGRNSGALEHPWDSEQEGLYRETVKLLRELLGDALPTRPAGSLLLTADETEARASAARLGGFAMLRCAVLDPDALSAAEPLVARDLWACRIEMGHPVRPRGAALAYADAARALGARFELGQAVELLREGAQATGVVHGAERRRFDVVLIAAGAWSAALLGHTGPGAPIRGSWGVNLAVALSTTPNHLLLEAAMTSIQSGPDNGRESAFSLIANAEHVALGSTFLRERPDPERWVARLLERATRFCPSAARARVLDATVCARPRSFDGRPLLGRVQGQPRLWIAAGHGGRGISTGPASARLVAGAISAGSDESIPAALRASRCAALG